MNQKRVAIVFSVTTNNVSSGDVLPVLLVELCLLFSCNCILGSRASELVVRELNVLALRILLLVGFIRDLLIIKDLGLAVRILEPLLLLFIILTIPGILLLVLEIVLREFIGGSLELDFVM